MYRRYRYNQPSGGGGGGALLVLILIMMPVMAAIAYIGYKKYRGEDPFGSLNEAKTPVYRFEMVNGEPTFTAIEPSDCKGTEYVKKKSCHNRQTGQLLDGTTGKCGDGVEEWVLNPNAPGYEPPVGNGTCESDFRPCNVVCDRPCQGATWIEGPCMRDGVILDGSETDKCGRGMRTYTLDENASDYAAALGRGTCTKNYQNACDVACPANAVAPPACVYSSTWQRSANGCVVSKEDRAAAVGYDQQGWQEYFKLALEAENCTGQKRLSEWETCTGPPGPVNCQGTWGQDGGWGACIGSCGTQPSQSRTYSVTQEAAHGGSQCPYSDGEVQTRNCGTIVPCPVDCQGYYTDPTCPTSCGTAASTVTKNWITTTQQVGTGAACPPATETKSCPATAVCPVDCQGYYTDPACPTACGTAASTLTKEWVTTTSPVGTGAACPSSSTKSCPATAACPADCQGYYTDPACPTACGTAASTLTKEWVTTVSPVGTGATCPSPSSKSCPATAKCRLPNGIYSIIGGRAGKYCSDESGKMICNRDNLDDYEKFNIEDHHTFYTIKGGRAGKYCSDEGGKVICNRDYPYDYEKFTIDDHGTYYTIKGGRAGKFCADEGGKVICNRDNAYEYERFTIAKAPAPPPAPTPTPPPPVPAQPSSPFYCNAFTESFECTDPRCRWSNSEEECVNR